MSKILKYISWEWLLLGAIALAVILRVINLGSRELWYDEVLSLLLSTGQKNLYSTPKDVPVAISNYQSLFSIPLENNISDIVNTGEKLLKGLVAEPHPPLFYLGQHLWLRLFGNSEAAMRSLPTLYSIGAIGCAYGIGRYLLGHRGGLLFAAILGLNPFYLFHSLNVRMYSPLVFWTVLSSWAVLETSRKEKKPKKLWFWSLILIFAVASGFMTFYYFLFFVASLGVLVLLWDRQNWWQHAIRLSIGVLIPVPWLLWGTRQQLNNADLGRFAAGSNWLETISNHIQGMIDTLTPQLIWGNWVAIMPPLVIILSGIVAIAGLIAISIHLWQQNHRQLLVVALCFGIVPFLMMVMVDVVSGKFTVGFGWGRSLIFILPGCLLLLTIWSEKAAGQWKAITALTLLLFYLTVNITDFSWRSRWMFHRIADIIEQETAEPTLVAMNSNAWGHVLRLAYYLPSESSVMLLAQNSAKLADALDRTLTTSSPPYQYILWLDSDRPVWGSPATEMEKKQVEQTLVPQFKLIEKERLVGTWELDNFTASLYQRRLPNS
ncbi:MAG: glycosyltransferase family 39 protein [Xenococcaceae cyanobacterium MO_188.B32]|nr:glycosyltransferase family 39 protein [Xenococcaceae cyanobacterium MO_188.B32]